MRSLADARYHGPAEAELADGTERDLEREPTIFRPRERQDLRRRAAFQAGVIDSVNRAWTEAGNDTDIKGLACPICRLPVYVPADSDRERIDCSDCGAVLRTGQSIAGVVLLELDAGNSTPTPEAP